MTNSILAEKEITEIELNNNVPVEQTEEPPYKQKWVRLANSKVAKAYKNRPALDIPLARNKLINKAYAEMYLSDPATFKWAGLASFASRNVGEKMELLRNLSKASVGTLIASFGTALPLYLISSEIKYLYKAVSEGNKLIFTDMYWQHLAYRDAGLEELERIYLQGGLPEKAIKAWRLLDEGKKTGNQDMIWQANIDILQREQWDIVHPALYAGKRNEDLWELISTSHNLTGVLITSPVPGVEKRFKDCVPNANLAKLKDRWKWCTDFIMPDWKAFETKYPKKVELLLKKIAA
ncbi:MAG: DUF2515 family protein [Chloroflexi bacterium]|uniref:DUF2515 family protein n=1 Tax=Candidatus Chlorohelix allophototropha TaxID=3003348 RepID=A0A8T7LYN4_9CHLR|nr:DUF2515 family protein [Chloroflexota bacterium]WJW66460.1 DUF2515 family protein [Chloroflexota bacterium L227-S17]